MTLSVSAPRRAGASYANSASSVLDDSQMRTADMKKILKFALALSLGVAFCAPFVVSSEAANKCHYTSGDKAKGYKC